ncbi:hypothetical protein AAMO2058_001037400 [Amorphochlora amoebiformis]
MDTKNHLLDKFKEDAQALNKAKFHKNESGHMIREPYNFKSIDPTTFSALKERHPMSPIAPNSEEKAILAGAQLDTQLTKARQERIRERGRGQARYPPWQPRTYQYETWGPTRPFHGQRDNQRYNHLPGRQFGRPSTSYPPQPGSTPRTHN